MLRQRSMRLAVVSPVAALAVGLALLWPALPVARHAAAVPVAPVASPATAAEFFSPTKVWRAHLSLSADAWRALQPRHGAPVRRPGFGAGRFLGPPGGRNGVAARQGIEFDYVHAALQIGDHTFPDVAVRYKGNGSYLRAVRSGSDKISLKVDLDKYVKGQRLAGLATLNLQNNITDIGWMNEMLAYRLYRDAAALAPRATYAEVYLTVAGQFEQRYLGLYSVSENVDEQFAEDRFGTRAGAIFKPSTPDLFTDLGPDWAAYGQIYDPKTTLTEAQKQRVMALSRLVSGASDGEFAAAIGDYIDLPSFARYLAVLVWLANYDSLLQNGQNFYTYLHPGTNRMHFVAWDQDFSFGNARNNGDWPVSYPAVANSRFLRRLYAVDAFRSDYLARVAEFSDTLFVADRFAKQVAEIGPVIRPSIAREGAEWLRYFDEIVAGRSGIVPYVVGRAASVRAELEKTTSPTVERVP